MHGAYDHSEFREHVEAYLAGGLAPDERAALEAHAAACAACAAVLSEAAAQDASLRELFDAARPPADLEDRLVRRLRAAPAPAPLLHPMVRRAATGVAAALMLGGFGYVAGEAVRRGELPTPWARLDEAAAPRGGASRGAAAPEFVDRFAAGTRGPVETPAEMARRFNTQASDFDADASRWMFYKTPSGGEGGGGSKAGRWGESQSRSPSPLSGPAPASKPTLGYPGMSAGPALVEEKLHKAVEDEARKETNREAAVDKQSSDFVQGDPKRHFGINMGGGGGGGRAGRGFGATNGAVAGGAAPAPDVSLYMRYNDANGRTSAAAPANRPASGGATELGIEMKAGEAGDVEGVVAGKDVRAKGGAFRPEAYFGAASPADGAAAPSDTELADEMRDRAAAPELVVQQLGQAAGGQPGDARTGAAPPAPAPADPGAPPRPAAPAEVNAAAARKIIRNGDMSFEVDGFDSAYLRIVQIAQEEGGFVATTDSEKLANGKVRGTVTVRVPPERLDTLVLKLRGLGDLKSSKLAAQDITKQYTDLESQLRASRAIEERLLNIIKTGKGEIKDLVEAEKQLGVYRERIEQVEGEIRYYNNLVSLSTLNVTLTERDIRTAATLAETEQVSMGVESPDVEKARAEAIKAIEEAKGRIVESDLKKLEAGQFAAKVVADVPPDAAGPLIDRMKQIGTVARLEVSRKQSAPEGTVAPTPAQGGAAVRLERRDTRFLISLYNLANVAPRQTTNLNIAAEDVEAAYRTILDQVKGAGGRVVTSQLNRPRPDQTTGTVTFEAPADAADVLLGAVRGTGEVMRLDVSQNPDAQNVTEAKRGFAVQVYSTASVAPRETTSLRVAARGVADTFNTLREAVRAAQGARILSSQLTEQDPANVTGTLDFEVRRADYAGVDAALRGAGQVVSRNVTRSADVENTVDTKVRLQVVLVDEAALQPRESVTVQLAVADVPGRYAKLLETLVAVQARVLQSQLSEQEAQNNVAGTLVFDVRRESRAEVDRALADAGDVVSRSVVRSTDTQNTLDDKVRLSLTLTDAAKLPPRETTTLGMEAADVEKAKEQVESLALSLGGRVVDSTLSREQNGRVIGKVVADVPLGRSIEMVRKTRDQGRVQFRRDARDETVPQGTLARARVDVTLANEELIVESGRGLGATIREGLRTSVTGLLWSLQLIVVGLFLVAPWALILWVGWRVVRRGKTGRQTSPATPAA